MNAKESVLVELDVMHLKFRQKVISLDKPVVMGILNVTPDSFSDGGQFNRIDSAVSHALAMLKQGAKIIDIGGESTRPGAALVTLDEELQRVIPVIQALRLQSDCIISIDTSKTEVMHQAVAAGADMINDVRALQEPGALTAAAQLQVPICLMHMQGTPVSMQDKPDYIDIIQDINHFFEQRIIACVNAGINKNQLLLDPGFGFGKTLEQNYQLLAELKQFQCFNMPLLVGMSRKSMLGKLLNIEADERLVSSVSCALIAAQNGGNIIRVHDVKETQEAMTILNAVNGSF